MYNPALGTFINLDPLESGSNLYAYCGDARRMGLIRRGRCSSFPSFFRNSVPR